jgi:hypothetical protein
MAGTLRPKTAPRAAAREHPSHRSRRRRRCPFPCEGPLFTAPGTLPGAGYARVVHSHLLRRYSGHLTLGGEVTGLRQKRPREPVPDARFDDPGGRQRARASVRIQAPAAAGQDACLRPGGRARRTAPGRSLRHESDRPGTPGEVIAFDGRRSRDVAHRDHRFGYPVGARGTTALATLRSRADRARSPLRRTIAFVAMRSHRPVAAHECSPSIAIVPQARRLPPRSRERRW